MGNIADILKDRQYIEPPEIAAIKDYVQKRYQSDVAVQVRTDVIIIKAPGASLATMLRLNSQDLIKSCKIEKRLLFRIG